MSSAENLIPRVTIHHDSTYKASDDFPVQKTIFRDSVALQLHPPFRKCPPDSLEPADSDLTVLP